MIQLVKGFHDILPDDSKRWDFLIRTSELTLERFGYRKIIPPVMERTELFERGIGQATDIVEKEMYTFEDRGGESLSLRPEATAGVLRAVAEHSLLKQEPVLKLYSIGPMFRRERPSKGRFRQFFQVNAELLGDDSPFTDAEIIASAHALVTNLGARGLKMEINSIGCRNCRTGYREELRDFLRPHLKNLCPDCRRRFDLNPLRVLDCKVEECIDIAKDAPLITDALDEPCREHFLRVQDALDLLSIPYRIEPKMVRGLDYYTRTAFEIIHEDFGRSKAIGGGGRYDSLLKELGGPDVGGIGFAVGLDRLSMGLADDGRFDRSIDVYIAVLGHDAQESGFKLAHDLRMSGISTEVRFSGKSLKAQMRIADKIGAGRVIMIGDEELKRRQVTVRDMKSKEQVSVNMESIVQYFQGEAS